MAFQFRPLYPDLDVPDTDPLLRKILTACETARLDPDQVNSTINAVLRRALAQVRDTGQPLSPSAFLELAAEHAKAAGLDLKAVESIAQQFTEGGSAGDGDPPAYDDARLLELEEFLTAQLETGQVTEAEFHRLFDAGQDIKGVEYISKLKDFAEGRAPSPGPFPKAASTDPTETTMTNDYPKVNPPMETPEAKAARDEHRDLRARQNSLYAMMSSALYSEHSPAGETYRADVARRFEAEFGSEDSAGSSEAGLGV
jgi:hypothetical protein